jgi:hypothetical protein
MVGAKYGIRQLATPGDLPNRNSPTTAYLPTTTPPPYSIAPATISFLQSPNKSLLSELSNSNTNTKPTTRNAKPFSSLPNTISKPTIPTRANKPLQLIQPRKTLVNTRKSIWNCTFPKTQLNTKSRRLVQRRKKRCIKAAHTSNEQALRLNQALHFTKLRCLHNFGFFVDSSKTLQQNFNKIITPDKLNPHCQPKNLTFHNLCNEQKPPIGTKNLLGLNLKFCLAPNNLQKILTPLFLKWHVPLEFPIT